MANIIEDFNNIQLDLITTGEVITYVFDETKGDYVKVTLYNQSLTDPLAENFDNFYSSFLSTNESVEIYRDADNQIYVKINEILENNSVPSDNYTVQFDFLRNIFSNFYTLTEGGCSSPDNNGTTLTEEECELLGNCNNQFEEGSDDFISEIECCGEDGSNCGNTSDETGNIWTGYQWTEATYQEIGGYAGSQFYVKEISPSRKEIRLIARNSSNDIIDFNDESFINNFANRNFGLVGGMGTLNESDSYGDYEFDYVISLANSVHLPIVNWTFDEASLDETTIVLRVNEPIPTNVTVLTPVNIEKKLFPTHEQNINYISNIVTTVIGGNLTPDIDAWSGDNNYYADNYQNYNQLLATASINNTDIDFVELENNNDYKNLNIDFSDFSNHILFGSAKSKLSNFKDKVKNIENNLNELSESLHQTGSHISSRRKDLFNNVLTIKKTFTPYEKFLYYGNDSGSYSAPNIGSNLAHQVPVNMANATELNNYDGFRLVHKLQNEPSTFRTQVFADKYFTQDPPFYNYSGSVYLSFLMKADEVAGNSLSVPFQWNNTNHGDNSRNIKSPNDCLYQNRILEQQLTGSEWRRFIFEASQSYWRPSGSAMNADNQGSINAVYNNFGNSDYWEVLSSAEKVFSASISGSTGTGYPILLDDNYNEFGTFLTGSGHPFTGSILPIGEYFNLNLKNTSGATAITSSFITDVKITFKNPDKALPFGEVYSTGSTEWTNWYDGLYASASTYDDNNIHSLKNNLPLKLIEDNEYENLHTFVDMWGEQFDLIRNHIDNYTNFYKRSYNKDFSTPSNLLPILSDNLGWELINPFSGSLSNYYNQFTGSAASNKEISENLWRRTLNNLIYIYKTKGTENSLKALINCLGYPSDLLTVNEFGGTNYTDTVPVPTSTFNNNIPPNNLGEIVGNHSYRQQSVPFGFFNLEGNNVIPLDWGSSANVGGVGPDDTIEFMFSSKPTTNTQELVSSHFGGSSLTSSFWDIRLLAGSTSESGSIQLRMNTSATPSAAGITHVVQTKELPIKDGSNFVNVMVQKTDLTSPTGEYSASLSLTVGKKSIDGDGFSFFETTSSTVNNVTQLDNWSSSNASRTTGNLLIGRDFTGSFAEVRVWSGSLSQSVFREHILNPSSVVGNQLLESQNNLYYRFKLNEQITSGSTTLTINDANPYGLVSNPTDFSKTITVSSSFGQISQRKMINITKFNFRNTIELNKNTRMINVGNTKHMISNLHPKKESSLSPQERNEKITSRNVEIVNSPADKINEYILDNLGGKDISQKISEWSDIFEPNYDDLDSLRELLLRGVVVDINKYIRTHAESGIYNPLFTNTISSIMPARIEFYSGIKIKSDILHRQKHKYIPPKVEEQEVYNADVKHPFYKTPEFNNGIPFTFSSSKFVDINEGNIKNIVELNGSDLLQNNIGTIKPYSSSSLVESSLIDIHEATYDNTDILDVKSSLINQYGEDNSLTTVKPELKSFYNLNHYSDNIKTDDIMSQSAVYNENYYTGMMTLSNITSESANYQKSHDTNLDMLVTPQISQSAIYQPTYNETISVKEKMSQSAHYNDNHYSVNYNQTNFMTQSATYEAEKKGILDVTTFSSQSAVYNDNHYEKTILLRGSNYMASASADYFDTNVYRSDLRIKNWSRDNGVFRNGTAFKSGTSTLLGMWGTGVNDLHFYDPLNHLPFGHDGKRSDTYNNVFRYTDQVVFKTIGNVEIVSQSFNPDLAYIEDTDYTDYKHFWNNEIRNDSIVDEEYEYVTLYNNTTSTQTGRPVGKTRFFRDDSGTLSYPSNHYIHYPTMIHHSKYNSAGYGSFGGDGHYLILDENGDVVSSSLVPSFQKSGGKNAQYDVKPTERAYRVEVGGSNTSKTLTITKK